MLFAHRVDLHECLKQLATGVGPGVPVKIHLRSEVKAYDADAASIELQNGTIVAADLVIAADGVHSIAVQSITGKLSPTKPGNHTNCAYRFLIPSKALDTDETRFFNQDPGAAGLRIFPHPEERRRLVSYPCRK